MITREEVLLKLGQLGKGPGEVAAALTCRNIKGLRLSCGDCPIARYLRGELQQAHPGVEVRVRHDKISLYLGSKHLYLYNDQHPNIDAACAFAEAFDDREYPELMEE